MDTALCAARAEQSVKKGLQGGAFRFLHEGLLKSVAFEDEPLGQKELIATILNHLVMNFLQADQGR